MKLHEIKNYRSPNQKRIEVEPAGGIYGTFYVEVEFNYQPPSSTLHVHDDPTTREHHPAEINIESIKLAEDVYEIDDEGDPKSDQVWKKGTDATKLPGWDKTDDDFVLDKIYDTIDVGANDYDDDYNDSRY